jgi:hypothetical protein
MRSTVFAFIALVCICIAAPAHAEPAAVILYTANSLGKYNPCPGCDEGEPIGGLARRSHIFAKYRGQIPETKLFILGGGNEFVPILPVDKPSNRETLFTAKAYAILDYDLGLLRQEEARRLQEARAEAMPAWKPYPDKPGIQMLEKGGFSIGIVLFPVPGNGSSKVDDEVMFQVAEAASGLRGAVDLVAGMSPWGEPNEKLFLESHPNVLDVLFGSGFGAGSGLRRVGESSTVWIRPEFNGWSIQALTITLAPQSASDANWKEGQGYDFESVRLDAEVAEDDGINALLQWL